MLADIALQLASGGPMVARLRETSFGNAARTVNADVSQLSSSQEQPLCRRPSCAGFTTSPERLVSWRRDASPSQGVKDQVGAAALQ